MALDKSKSAPHGTAVSIIESLKKSIGSDNLEVVSGDRSVELCLILPNEKKKVLTAVILTSQEIIKWDSTLLLEV